MSELQQDYIDKLEGQVRELRQRVAELEEELKDANLHNIAYQKQLESNSYKLGKCVACGNPSQDQTQEHFVAATASEGARTPEDSNPQRVEAPRTVKDSLMVDRIADCLVEDHIELMNECDSMRQRVAELATDWQVMHTKLAACEKERDGWKEQVEREWMKACDLHEKLQARQHYSQQLREALEEAAIEISDWGQYASEYFQEKHDLNGSVAKFQAIARQAHDTSALDALVNTQHDHNTSANGVLDNQLKAAIAEQSKQGKQRT